MRLDDALAAETACKLTEIGQSRARRPKALVPLHGKSGSAGKRPLESALPIVVLKPVLETVMYEAYRNTTEADY